MVQGGTMAAGSLKVARFILGVTVAAWHIAPKTPATQRAMG